LTRLGENPFGWNEKSDRRDAEAVVRFDPIFPADPFAS
jgi:hypothetical protein